jgi:hypothetical protein
MTHIEQLTNLNRIHEVELAMKGYKSKTKLQVFCKSKFDIPFENFDVVYFDPPYQNTTGYQRGTFSQIMFKALLKVLIDSGKMVFVSEYNAPADGFVEVASFKKRTLPGATTFAEDLEGWSRICDNIQIWDYTVDFMHYLMPFPNFQVLKPNINFFIKNHAIGIVRSYQGQAYTYYFGAAWSRYDVRTLDQWQLLAKQYLQNIKNPLIIEIK